MPAVRDVADDRDHEHATGALDGAQADLDRELLTRTGGVRADRVPRPSPGPRVPDIAVTVAEVPVADRRRHQELDRLPDQLVARVLEHRLGHRVGEDDGARLVDHDDAVGRGVDRAPQRIVGERAAGVPAVIGHGGHEPSGRRGRQVELRSFGPAHRTDGE